MVAFINFLCRVIVTTEGAIGLVLNAIVILLLWNRKIRSGWSTYRIGMSFTAVQGVLISLLAITACISHLFSKQNYILIIYGPLAYFPRIFSDIAVFLELFLIIGIWDYIPASCLLQYLALCKPSFSNTKRIVYSFSLSTVLMLCSMPQYTTFHTPPSRRPLFDNITISVHELTTDDVFYAYGATLFPTPRYKKAVIYVAVFAILPPYFIAYVIFIWCCARISRALGSFGIKLSPKTMHMQRSFLRMLLLQALLPLLVLSVPMATFVRAMLTGDALDKQTLIITFTIYVVPIVQGAVALVYVRGMGLSSSRASANSSKATRMSTHVETY